MIDLEEGENVVVTSPNFPLDYGNNLDITWLVSAPENLIVGVNFTNFSLEFDYDFLHIGYGPEPNAAGSEYLGSLTGTEFFLNGSILPFYTETWIRFTSDTSTGDSGFRLELTAIPVPGELDNRISDNNE